MGRGAGAPPQVLVEPGQIMPITLLRAPRILRPSDSLVNTEHNLQSREETNKHKNKMDNKQMVLFLYLGYDSVHNKMQL